MNKKFNFKIGNFQQKTVIMMLLMLFITVAIFSAGVSYQNNKLARIVGDTREEQHEAISRSSEKTMHQLLASSLVQNTYQQAKIANNDFSEIINNIKTLQTLTEALFENRTTVPKTVRLPEPFMDGLPSTMVLFEEGVDYTQSVYLGIAANLSDAMTAMLRNSDKIDSLYIGLVDGTDLCVDDSTLDKLDRNGYPIPFPVRERPWYTGAVESNALHFTGILPDAFSGRSMVTCSAPVKARGKLVGVVGIDIVLESMDDFVDSASETNGSVFIVNENGHVILSSEENGIFAAEKEESVNDLRASVNTEFADFLKHAYVENTDLCAITLNGRQFYAAGAPMPAVGWAMVSIVDKELTEQPERDLLAEYDRINNRGSEEFRKSMSDTTKRGGILTVILFLASAAVAMLVAGKIVKPLEEMTSDIRNGGKTGRLFEMKETYRTNDEIQVLAEAFVDLSKRTEKYIKDITQITKETERVNTELNMANQIQHSMLPHTFPAFPDRHEFDIYAVMNPAKEVGGDFYDYFLVDDDHLCMVIADVSGKGIPAALFMMISKVILQNNAALGVSPAEVLYMTNSALCSGNSTDMFVTVWLGILEISTGKIVAANAGHEYPVLLHDGKFALQKDKHGFILGGMDGMRYKNYEIQMNPGDKLFIYTDGVPEATNAENELFGLQRLVDVLNEETGASPVMILANVRSAVDEFVGEAEQFDDLTMLCMEYKSPE